MVDLACVREHENGASERVAALEHKLGGKIVLELVLGLCMQ
jgi:hypothetical protein